MSQKAKSLNTLNRANIRLNDMLNRVYEVDESLLNQKPDANSWSVIQVLNHLYDVEFHNLKHQKYKIEQGDKFPKETFISKAKFIALHVAYVLPIKFKAPAAINNPSNNDSFEEIQEKYAALRQEHLSFLEKQNETYFRTASCKHPAVGRLTMLKMLRFYILHITHHEKQILRTLIKLSK